MGQKKTQKAIYSWLNGEGNELLIAELPYLKKRWKKLAKEENDYRSGEETYGYSDEESIRNNMEYISDRWMAAFRIKWLIDGLNSEKI